MSNNANNELTYSSNLTLSDATVNSGVVDDRSGQVYVYTPELKFAVEVALSTGRPLLLRGRPGTGKSSLAAYVARNLNWRYYEHVVIGATEARDMLWTQDAVRRLADANTRQPIYEPLDQYKYVEPGVLWWALDPASARRRGKQDVTSLYVDKDGAEDPFRTINEGREANRAVVLIDEIDKADPDVPNSLLVPLGSREFYVDPIRTWIRCSEPENKFFHPVTKECWPLSRVLVIITTNEERDLPDAFLRRCVVHELPDPDAAQLTNIAKAHFPAPWDNGTEEMFKAVAEKLVDLRRQAESRGVRVPSTAEYLDTLRAMKELKISISSDPNSEWALIERLLLLKHRTLSYAEP